MTADLVRGFFAAADTLDTERFLAVLCNDVVWRFGNQPQITGLEPVRGVYEFMRSNLVSMHHEVVGVWTGSECHVAETRVTYGDAYGRTFSFPACNLFFLRDGLVGEVRIFVDNHELFEPPQDLSTSPAKVYA